MTGTRLFVGGLSLELEESVLSEHFSNYGTITKLDIKDKKDLVTGEVIKRFAFATLDASSSSIDQCKMICSKFCYVCACLNLLN